MADVMVELCVTNTTGASLALEFVPGMVLGAPQGSNIQSVMLEGQASVALAAGESVTVPLTGYCLDFKAAPPPKGQSIAFTLSGALERYAAALQVLYAGLALDAQGKYTAILAPLQHRRIVIQRALWAVLEQKPARTAADKEKMRTDVKADVNRAGRSLATRELDRLTNNLWADVRQTLERAGAR
ncbi:MAG: hypothetical protein EB084_16025 [Proteobacteria bacterium]|nr:hypothetical protein [Pseudomonadota bacterium]